MKGIIIENDYAIPHRIAEFLKHQPNFFETVRLEIGCNKRPLSDLLPFLKEYDAVLIDSTFLDKGQVEELVQALYSGVLGAHLKFYIADAVGHINRWLYAEKSHFPNYDTFEPMLLELLNQLEVYTLPWLEHEKEEAPARVRYSANHHIVHRVDEDPQTVIDRNDHKY